jgi:small subunit ribosomal protein S9
LIDDERTGDEQQGDAPEEPVEPAPAADPGESPVAGEEPEGGPEGAEPEEAAPAPEEPASEPAADEAAAGQAGAEEPAAAETGAPEEAAAGAAPEQAEERAPGRPRRERGGESRDEVVPGAHLEPDLVLEEEERAEGEFAGYEQVEYAAEPEAEGAEAPPAPEEPEARPAARTPMDLAADARYQATGKRKTSVARVILRPGSGTYTVNGRPLDEMFPRPALQKAARQPLDAAGYGGRMDVVARIHGGGVSAQAGALRHGVARALVEADPNLRGELKRRGFLTRDARVKERKKAGLKKARKRPQFSKR